MLSSLTKLSSIGKLKTISIINRYFYANFSLTGIPQLIKTRSVIFRDKKMTITLQQSSIPPHLEKQQGKALEKYKINESLLCNHSYELK
jgi:hypothetical protein